MARILADRGHDAIFSYAGRTNKPIAQPLPTRIGGFGGVEGLIHYLKDHAITHVIDATHPFAAQMTRNAHAACQTLALPLAGLERAAWQAQEGDQWTTASSIEEAVEALPDCTQTPARVFLAIGKQTLQPFAAKPCHHYLLRLVDEPDGDLPLSRCDYVVERGPFTLEGDYALLKAHKIEIIVSKNAGGVGAAAKLDAARKLGLKVVMIDRPETPQRSVFDTPDQILQWLHHSANLGV